MIGFLVDEKLIFRTQNVPKTSNQETRWILMKFTREMLQSILCQAYAFLDTFSTNEYFSSDPKCGVLASSESVASLIDRAFKCERNIVTAANQLMLRVLFTRNNICNRANCMSKLCSFVRDDAGPRIMCNAIHIAALLPHCSLRVRA